MLQGSPSSRTFIPDLNSLVEYVAMWLLRSYEWSVHPPKDHDGLPRPAVHFTPMRRRVLYLAALAVKINELAKIAQSPCPDHDR